MTSKINIDHEQLTGFCRKWRIKRLWLFGSVLREDFNDNSDVDVLYEFEPEQHLGWHILDVEEELVFLLNRKVDFVSEKYLNKRIRNHPAFKMELIYGEG